MKVEPGNILKLLLNFSNFEPQYSYRLYSYKKKRVYSSEWAYLIFGSVICTTDVHLLVERLRTLPNIFNSQSTMLNLHSSYETN